jgi:hypothetical protein
MYHGESSLEPEPCRQCTKQEDKQACTHVPGSPARTPICLSDLDKVNVCVWQHHPAVFLMLFHSDKVALQRIVVFNDTMHYPV